MSRRRPRSCPLLLACAAAAVLAAPADARPLRVFLVQQKHRLEDASSFARFRDKVFALVDAAERRAGLVQPGIDDVASHLAPVDPGAPEAAVVHFPEGIGLVAALIGPRGVPARSAATAFDAFAALLGTYAEQTASYDARFPSLAGQPIRSLQLALTDVVYRSVYETFRDVARRYRIHVSVNLDAAPARRIEAADDPELVERLRDPEAPDPSYAWEATTDLPQNIVWLFDPDGEVLVPDRRGGLLRSPSETGGVVLPSAAKVYLTPIEQGLDKPGGGLSLASASARDLEVLPTAVGAIGVVISKDAWMVDVNERLEAKGASFLLQSEAFDVWGFAADPWAPDGFLQGGWFQLQEKAGFLFNATPSLTGNLFDITFDGQSALLGKAREKRRLFPRGAPTGFVGQPRRGGFLTVAPWIVGDPPAGTALPRGDSLAARRRALADLGVHLLPGSGTPCSDPLAVGPCENGYREWVLRADVEIPDGPGAPLAPVDRSRRATSFGASRPVAPTATGHQRRPRAAAEGDVVAVVWDDGRDPAAPQVFLAISTDGGRSFGEARRVSDAPDGGRVELFPDVAVGDGVIHVVWQAFDDGFDDDRGSIAHARFDRAGVKLGPDVRVDGGADVPAGRWQPRIALLGGGDPYVVWIDERDTGPDGVALAHVWGARGEDGGARFGAPVRIDAGEPTALAASLDNRWSPAVAADGDAVHVAWTDFRSFDWDIRTTRSTDRGASFAPDQELSTACFFCDSPAVLRRDDGRLWIAWTDLRAGPPDATLQLTESRDDGATFAPHVPLDDARRVRATGVRDSNQSHVSLAASGGRVYAAWQDDRAGNNDILFAAVDPYPRGVRSPERVDDSGDGSSQQYRPELVVVRGRGTDPRCVVFWEDDRDGRVQIYTASRSCSRAPSRLPRRGGASS